MFKYDESALPEQYKAFVREQAKTNGAAAIPNRTLHSAIFIMKQFFGIANDQVRVMAGQVPDLVFRELEPEIMAAVQRGAILRIVVWEEKKESIVSPTLLRIMEHYPAKIELRFVGSSPSADRIAHFMTVDGHAYRLEQPHPRFWVVEEKTAEQMAVQAQACFYELGVSAQLDKIFDQVWKMLGSATAGQVATTASPG